MPALLCTHIIVFDTTLSRESFSRKMRDLVDFNTYVSTAMITKEFYGDSLSPVKYGLRKKPLIPGLLDVFTNISPYITVELRRGKVRVSIRDDIYLLLLIVSIIPAGLALAYVLNFFAFLSLTVIILTLLIGAGMASFILYLANKRCRSNIRTVEMKLIEHLKT